jgi:hypothetical protein
MKARTSLNSFDSFTLLFLATALAYGAEEGAQQLVVPDGKAYKGRKITAKVYNSHFALGHDS